MHSLNIWMDVWVHRERWITAVYRHQAAVTWCVLLLFPVFKMHSQGQAHISILIQRQSPFCSGKCISEHLIVKSIEISSQNLGCSFQEHFSWKCNIHLHVPLIVHIFYMLNRPIQLIGILICAVKWACPTPLFSRHGDVPDLPMLVCQGWICEPHKCMSNCQLLVWIPLHHANPFSSTSS